MFDHDGEITFTGSGVRVLIRLELQIACYLHF